MISFVGFSSKLSLTYGRLGLIVSGGIGCGIAMNFGKSFLDVIVSKTYLGRMLMGFGYTIAMAAERYTPRLEFLLSLP